MSDVIFSLDIGTRSIIGTVGIIKNSKFHVLHECYKEHEERAMIDGQIHDIKLVAQSVQYVKNNLEEKLGFDLTKVAIAAAGRFLRTSLGKSELKLEENSEIDKDLIRSLELTAVKKAEEDIFKTSEGKLYCVGYSVKSYYLNGYLISNLLSHKGDIAAADVIATFLPRSVIDSLYAVMDKVGLDVVSLTLEPIAAIEAVIPQKLRLLNLALVDIGAGTSDIAIANSNTISAYGMVPMAGDEITEIVAQSYLVDFNMAEEMKKQCVHKEIIEYKDVLGLENTVTREEILKVIDPVVNKIAYEISSKVIELNGGKSPNAIFLVGGGAYTPGIKESLSKELSLPEQRIGIKGRDTIEECVVEDNSLGSIGVTVLGIALVAIRNLGHEFMDVILNGNVVSLFNSHKNKVIDVLLQSGINPKILICKRGKNLKFKINGISRIAFGTLGTNAKIELNGKEVTMEDEVKEGDKIDLIPAIDGVDGVGKIKEYVKEIYSVKFKLNNEELEMCPKAYLNGDNISLDYDIQRDDDIEIVYPETIKDLKKYYIKDNKEVCIENNILRDDYIIKDDDTLEFIIDKLEYDDESLSKDETNKDSKINDIILKENINKDITKSINVENTLEEKVVNVIVNEDYIKLHGKKAYIFVDIFDFIDFDLTIPKGNIVLKRNDKDASYYDELHEGDVVKIYWE